MLGKSPRSKFTYRLRSAIPLQVHDETSAPLRERKLGGSLPSPPIWASTLLVAKGAVSSRPPLYCCGSEMAAATAGVTMAALVKSIRSACSSVLCVIGRTLQPTWATLPDVSQSSTAAANEDVLGKRLPLAGKLAQNVCTHQGVHRRPRSCGGLRMDDGLTLMKWQDIQDNVAPENMFIGN